MASLPGPESRDVQEMIRHLKWSPAEKQIARKAFELGIPKCAPEASVRTEYREANPRGPKELQGLGEDKLESIRSYAKLLAKFEEVGLKTWRLMNDRSSARSTGTVIRLSEPNLTRLQYSPCPHSKPVGPGEFVDE